MATPEYDFVIVGSGPAGSALATRLSQAKTPPSILLIEAGGLGSAANKHELWERYQTAIAYPEDTWGYLAQPSENIDGRVLPYARGKVLGGSSVVNFCVWTVGPRDDFDRWSDEVQDEAFNWQHRLALSKNIEAFRDNIGSEHRPFVDADLSIHGKDGPIGVEYAAIWERGAIDRLESAREHSWSINLDTNDGDPIGVHPTPTSSKSGYRSSAREYVKLAGPSLTVKCECFAEQILFDDDRAIGIRTTTGDYFASKEVIICCGAIDSPKLLLLSGIGPKEELADLGINARLDLPGVGKNLEEHVSCPFVWLERLDSHSDWASFASKPEDLQAAREEFATSGTGPLANMWTGLSFGYFKADELLDQPEFRALPKDFQKHLRKPTVPLYEICMQVPNFDPTADQTKSWMTVVAILQNMTSRGSVSLRSKNCREDPIIDLNMLATDVDRAIARRATREILSFAETPSIKQDLLEVSSAPVSSSDEDIDAYWRQNAGCTWHASCTVKMGRPDDPMSCLDSDFRVRGLQNLRVADLSSTPFLPSCHTTSVAYFIGETLAAKLLKQYSL